MIGAAASFLFIIAALASLASLAQSAINARAAWRALYVEQSQCF
jgi:hypothetical protein